MKDQGFAKLNGTCITRDFSEAIGGSSSDELERSTECRSSVGDACLAQGATNILPQMCLAQLHEFGGVPGFHE